MYSLVVPSTFTSSCNSHCHPSPEFFTFPKLNCPHLTQSPPSFPVLPPPVPSIYQYTFDSMNLTILYTSNK